MHIPWSEVQLFLAIAESRSLSAAARTLRVAQPTVSRKLADLEAMLGEPLFVRSVEGVALTSFGERMLAPARRMAECAGEVERAASGAEARPKGVVRVTAPPGVAYVFLAPLAAHAREVLPEVRLEVASTVSHVDLVRREADLALRLQPLDRPSTQRDLVCLATNEHPVAAFATPEYIAKLPPGYGVRDVGWIGWAPPLEHVSPNPQLAALVPGFAPVFASDDYIVQFRAAEAGVGAILFGRFRSRFAMPTPLVELALSFGKLTSTLHLVSARSSLTIARVKAVADLLARELMAPPSPATGAVKGRVRR
ncbi:MAG TPA: LysR family transcriptional regulator [Polyangiaceae bacterium]|jgi:DNA-binding transcriptional LysR family regulator|nr:LysR family transcriptional regulator [Polyangiaceae bacterium]